MSRIISDGNYKRKLIQVQEIKFFCFEEININESDYDINKINLIFLIIT